jgi:hypothetical protein
MALCLLVFPYVYEELSVSMFRVREIFLDLRQGESIEGNLKTKQETNLACIQLAQLFSKILLPGLHIRWIVHS